MTFSKLVVCLAFSDQFGNHVFFLKAYVIVYPLIAYHIVRDIGEKVQPPLIKELLAYAESHL